MVLLQSAFEKFFSCSLKMEITHKFKDALTRQANEAVRIYSRPSPELLNSKSEFNHPPLARVVVQKKTTWAVTKWIFKIETLVNFHSSTELQTLVRTLGIIFRGIAVNRRRISRKRFAKVPLSLELCNKSIKLLLKKNHFSFLLRFDNNFTC